MLDLDFGKLLLLAVIALIVIGPKRLPKAARMAGAVLRRARTQWDSVRTEVEREIQLEEIKRAAREAAAEASATRAATESAVRDVTAAARTSAAEVNQAVSVTPAESPHGDT